jgi:hypothetical protein
LGDGRLRILDWMIHSPTYDSKTIMHGTYHAHCDMTVRSADGQSIFISVFADDALAAVTIQRMPSVAYSQPYMAPPTTPQGRAPELEECPTLVTTPQIKADRPDLSNIPSLDEVLTMLTPANSRTPSVTSEISSVKSSKKQKTSDGSPQEDDRFRKIIKDMVLPTNSDLTLANDGFQMRLKISPSSTKSLVIGMIYSKRGDPASGFTLIAGKSVIRPNVMPLYLKALQTSATGIDIEVGSASASVTDMLDKDMKSKLPSILNSIKESLVSCHSTLYEIS